MMQPACDQDAQIQQVLDRLGLTPQQVLHHHHTFGDRLSASTGRLGARIPERVLPPVSDGLRWRINPETLHEAKGIMKHGEWLPWLRDNSQMSVIPLTADIHQRGLHVR